MLHSIFRWWPVALLHAALCHAVPFTPAGEDTVVERLPARIGTGAERQQQRALREQLRQHPAELPLATRLARDAIERARRDGDPRELGQAEAALAPWWRQPAPPPPVRLLRAIVRQSQHDFEPALQDLDALLQPGPQPVPLALQAQAELTRASVLQVQGHWRAADAGCERLLGAHYAALGSAVRRPAQVCRAELMSLQGQAAAAAQALAVLAREPGADAGWLALVQAELAERRGDASAEAFYRHAVAASSPPDVYTLAAWADWLLAQHRERDAAALLAGREDADALLLRLAIAWKRSADPRAPQAIATLAARFDAARLRGDRSHGRELARYQLDLLGDAPAALGSAQANWVVQKEPADALLMVRAALAARRPQAAQPVWQLVRDTGWQDMRLLALAGSGE
ncbi:hypothetical protein [Rhizobacter sp. SG703]|uniref:hypothetical protein n=1 Tax=Rhizobacter sp. SG703 TaxID=2587140 RepID=UPI0014486022|nr:hypothetical protein [Rhizobacter sp. SG703]NKI95757.1 hypothetical protein [Rhizobacter sp. SG703]